MIRWKKKKKKNNDSLNFMLLKGILYTHERASKWLFLDFLANMYLYWFLIKKYLYEGIFLALICVTNHCDLNYCESIPATFVTSYLCVLQPQHHVNISYTFPAFLHLKLIEYLLSICIPGIVLGFKDSGVNKTSAPLFS